MTDKAEGSGGSEDLRQRLLTAAIDLLKEPETPLDLRKVAERAGKSRTAPYLVFGKESEGGGVIALRIAVAAEGARMMSRVMREAAEISPDPIASFHAVAEAFLLFAETNPRLSRLIFGPEINAIGRLGEGGFRDHPEFQRFLKHRADAQGVVTALIWEAQRQGVLPGDPRVPHALVEADDFQDLPSTRFLAIAFATMIGVSVLREDDLLQAIGWNISLRSGARGIAEAVLGLDPGSLSSATKTFLESPGVDPMAGSLGAEADAPPEVASLRRTSPFHRMATDHAESLVGIRKAMGPPDEDLRRFVDEVREHVDSLREVRERVDSLELEVREPRPQYHAIAPPQDEEILLPSVLDSYPGLRRAAYSKKRMEVARILWIDDRPEGIASVVETIRHLGAHITVVESTEEAVEFLASQEAVAASGIQVVVSDIARAGRADEGTRAIPRLREVAPHAEIIFYIADLDTERGIPDGARGITNRTDELLHLILDVLEGR